MARKQQGFTIIEVVLVLAIAGLIFLMVFIALPTLQKNQRDTQRRNDVSRFKAQINQFQANNKGDVPTSGSGSCTTATGNVQAFVTKYMVDAAGKGWDDPSDGNSYSGKCKETAAGVTAAGDWYYQRNGQCQSETIVTGTGNRQYAIIMKLEGSGIACMDNQ